MFSLCVAAGEISNVLPALVRQHFAAMSSSADWRGSKEWDNWENWDAQPEASALSFPSLSSNELSSRIVEEWEWQRSPPETNPDLS